ncbi:hypothetical protein ACFFRR_004226 [Megaselia abdita]
MHFRFSFAVFGWLMTIVAWLLLSSILNSSHNHSNCKFYNEFDRDYLESYGLANNDESEIAFNFSLIIFAMCIMFVLLASSFLFFRDSLTSKDFGRFLKFGGVIITALIGCTVVYHVLYVMDLRYCGEDRFGVVLFEIALFVKIFLSAVSICGIPAYIWIRIWKLHKTAVNDMTRFTADLESKPYVLLPDFKLSEDVQIVPVHLPSSKVNVLSVKELESIIDGDEAKIDDHENNIKENL